MNNHRPGRGWMPGLLLALAASVLTACSGDEPAPESYAPAAPTAASSVDGPSRMAKAVMESKPGVGVEIRYEVAAKPQVGVPVEIQIAFVVSVDASVLTARVAGMDGLTLANDEVPPMGDLKAGETRTHTLTVTPQRAGVFYVAVSATSLVDGVAATRSFSIPLLVGDSLEAAQKPAAAPTTTDSTGQTIRSLPAESR